MNFFSLIELNREQSIIKYLKQIKNNQSTGIAYRFIKKIDKVLKHFKDNDNQLEIIKKKIIEVKNVEFFWDVLAELLIIHEYLSDGAEFIEETESITPDIKSNKYLIEVKKIRSSNEQISVLDELLNNKNSIKILSSSTENLKKNDESDALNKKIEDKINKAIKQIGGKEGIIYIIYSIDLLGHCMDLCARKKDFECYCLIYFNLKQIKHIKLFVVDLNDLISK